MHLIIGKSPFLLLVSLLSLLCDLVDAQAVTVSVPPQPYMAPFNLPPDATAPYAEGSNVMDANATEPNSPVTTGSPDSILGSDTTGLKGVHPHGDRLKRTLCYCSSTVAETRNSGSSYYHMEYSNSQLDLTHQLNWTCIHRKEDNACEDKPKVHDKQFTTSAHGAKFCFEQREKVVWDDKYTFGGFERTIPFEVNGPFPAPRGSKHSTPKDVVTAVCAKLCEDFVGPPADLHDEFFNGIAYFKNSIDEFYFLDDICLDGGKGNCPDPK